MILSDINMPKMNGKELLSWLKNEIPDYNAEFLFITGGIFIDQSNEDQYIFKLSDGFIEKPFTEEHLISEINKLFK